MTTINSAHPPKRQRVGYNLVGIYWTVDIKGLDNGNTLLSMLRREIVVNSSPPSFRDRSPQIFYIYIILGLHNNIELNWGTVGASKWVYILKGNSSIRSPIKVIIAVALPSGRYGEYGHSFRAGHEPSMGCFIRTVMLENYIQP